MSSDKQIKDIVSDILFWNKPVESNIILKEVLKTFNQHNATILNICQQDLIRKCTQPKDEVLKNPVCLNVSSSILESLAQLYESLASVEINKLKMAHVNFCKIADYPNVKFYPHETIVTKDNKKKYSKFPTMDIILERSYGILEGVCIDTGFIMEIMESRFGDEFVIVPFITSSADILPSIICRDRYDSGLLTVNFTTLNAVEKGSKLSIFFIAFEALQPSTFVNMSFKKKNCQLYRCVANAKELIDFESFKKAEDEDNTVTFNYNDSGCIKSSTIVTKKNEHVLLSSRKREWHDENSMTVTGFFSETNFIPPQVYLKPKEKNTHCFTCVGRRVRIISNETQDFSKCKILNGSFQFMKNYQNKKKAIERMIENTLKFEKGIETIFNENVCEDWELKLILLNLNRFYNKDLYESKRDMSIEDICKTRNTKRESMSVELFNSLFVLLQYDNDDTKKRKIDEIISDDDNDTENENENEKNMEKKMKKDECAVSIPVNEIDIK